jgi:hypothetical protein
MPDDEQLPGFVDENLNKQQAKASSKQAAPAFNPFANVPVSTSPAPTAGAASAARSSAPSAESEGDIRPGQGKDLWACPHCGARNKPDRTTCRGCNKSPHDEVIVPWHQNIAARIGIAVGVVAIIALFAFSLGGPPKFVQPGPDSLDSKVRIGGSSNVSVSIGEAVFTGRKILAVSGRVLAAQAYAKNANVTTVVLALGSGARDDVTMDNVVVDFSGDEPTVDPQLPHAVLYLVFDQFPAPAMKLKEYFSLIGDVGSLEAGGFNIAGSSASHVVRVNRISPN